MIVNKYNNGGGSSSGSSQYAASAGTSNSTKLLMGGANFPQDANNGDVVAIGEQAPTRGTKGNTKSATPQLGIYQYDGSDWNKIEGGEGGSGYKIELSTNIPDDFQETDIANLNDFFAAFEADPSIGDNAYIKIGTEIFKCSNAAYDGENHNGEFNFVLTYSDYISEIYLSFADGEYVEGFYYGNNLTSYVIDLSTPNPDDFAEGDVDLINGLLSNMDNGTVDLYNVVIRAADYVYQLAYFDDNGTIGFAWQAAFAPRMQYIELHYEDGEYTDGAYSEWEPESASDVTLLKSVSATPATVGQGDVFALTTPAQEGSWTTFDGSAGATLVRILTKNDGTYLFHFDNDNLFTALDYTGGTPATFDGSGWGLQQDDTYEWHYDNNGYYIRVWAEEEKGDWYIYADMTQGDGGFSMLDAYSLGSQSQMFYGAEPAKVQVLQRYITPAEDIVEITYPECSDEGGGRWQGRKVRVAVSGVPDDDYYLTEFERFDNFAELHIDGQRLYLHSNSTDEDIFSVPLAGGIGSGLFGEVFIMATYSSADGAFNIQAYDDLAFNDQGAVVNGGVANDFELAKKSDIPEGGNDFVHLDSLNTVGEVGKTYEYQGMLMKWVEGSGYTAEWLKKIDQIEEKEGTGLIYSVIPDGTTLFEYRAGNSDDWRKVVYSGNTLYYAETGGTIISAVTYGQNFTFPGISYPTQRRITGVFKRGYIGFCRPQSANNHQIQNLWSGYTENSHYELIDKYNYPYVEGGNSAGVVKFNEKGQVIKPEVSTSVRNIYFNTSGYSSTGFITNGANNGPDRIWVPTTGGNSGQILQSNGSVSAPSWIDWIKAVKISSAGYDALVQAGTTDPNTLYLIVDE